MITADSANSGINVLASFSFVCLSVPAAVYISVVFSSFSLPPPCPAHKAAHLNFSQRYNIDAT